MIGWFLIGILVLLIFTVLRVNHMKHRFTLIAIIILALFLVLSVWAVYKQNKLDFNSTQGISNSIKIYFGWVANAFHNMKDLTGNAIKMNWTSTDSSFNKPAKNQS